MQLIRHLAFLCLATFLAACSGGSSSGSGGTGTISLKVTDAPFEYDIVQSASVSVDKITIFHDSNSEAGPIVLYEGAPILMDLFHLHPVIHVTNLGHVGGLTGTVTQDDGQGGLLPVASATVYVLPPGQTDTTQAVATTGTSATGTYTVIGIQPGPYDVMAVKAALGGTVAGVTVVSGEVATVDVTIH